MWMLVAVLGLAFVPLGQAPVWHEVSSARDLTGDGSPETLRVTAFGTRSDSLQIVFTIDSGERQLFRQEWSSTHYFFGYGDYDSPAAIPSAERDSVMRDRLDDFFRSQSFSTFAANVPEFSVESVRYWLGYGTPRVSPAGAADSLAQVCWDDVTLTRPVVFSYSKGYEAIFWIAWSGKAGAFVTVGSCC